MKQSRIQTGENTIAVYESEGKRQIAILIHREKNQLINLD